jgi:alcohol dehydrogenase
MKQAASGPIDCVLDIPPLHAGVRPVRAAALTVRPYGRVVLMGGIARAEAD